MINHDVEKKVINDIKKYIDMPEEGTIAGQFLASLFYKHLQLDLSQPLNDIDIFVSQESSESPFRTFISEQTFVTKQASLSEKNPEMENRRFYSVINSIYVPNAKSDIPINIINVKSLSDFKGSYLLEIYKKNKEFLYKKANQRVDPKDIISSFDLNCCAVAYSIEESKFYYTSGFLDFIQTKKLQIQSLHSPHATLIRMFNKIKEINCLSDIDNEINLIKLYGLVFDNKFIIGKRFNELIDSSGNDIIADMIQYRNNYKVHIRKYEDLLDNNKIKEVYDFFNLNKACYVVHNHKVLIRLFYEKVEKEESRIFSCFENKTIGKNFSEQIIQYWLIRLINRYALADIQVDSILDNIHYTKKLSKEYGEIVSLGYDFKEPKDLEEFCSMFFDNEKINTFTINMFKNNLITYQDIQNKKHKKEILDYKNKVKKEIKTVCPFVYKYNHHTALWFDSFKGFDGLWKTLAATSKEDAFDNIYFIDFFGKKRAFKLITDSKEVKSYTAANSISFSYKMPRHYKNKFYNSNIMESIKHESFYVFIDRFVKKHTRKEDLLDRSEVYEYDFHKKNQKNVSDYIMELITVYFVVQAKEELNWSIFFKDFHQYIKAYLLKLKKVLKVRPTEISKKIIKSLLN